MPYPMNEPQFRNVCALSSKDRMTHFIRKAAGFERLWGVACDESWLTVLTPDGLEYLPVWPHPVFAERTTEKWHRGYKPVEISLKDFLDDWLPNLQSDGVKVGVFPDMEWILWILEPQDLADELREEHLEMFG